MTPRSAEEIAREAREIALDAVQSADRAFELCACKSEHRLIEALVSRIAAALVARAEAAERRVWELEEALGALLAVARQAAERFREYERHHAAKPDSEKAARNGEMAARLEAAIESSQRVVAIRALKEAP